MESYYSFSHVEFWRALKVESLGFQESPSLLSGFGIATIYPSYSGAESHRSATGFHCSLSEEEDHQVQGFITKSSHSSIIAFAWGVYLAANPQIILILSSPNYIISALHQPLQ